MTPLEILSDVVTMAEAIYSASPAGEKKQKNLDVISDGTAASHWFTTGLKSIA